MIPASQLTSEMGSNPSPRQFLRHYGIDTMYWRSNTLLCEMLQWNCQLWIDIDKEEFNNKEGKSRNSSIALLPHWNFDPRDQDRNIILHIECILELRLAVETWPGHGFGKAHLTQVINKRGDGGSNLGPKIVENCQSWFSNHAFWSI